MKISQAAEFLEKLAKVSDEGISGFSSDVRLVWGGDDARGQVTKDGKDGCWDIEFEAFDFIWMGQSEIEKLIKVANSLNLVVRAKGSKWQIYHFSDAEEESNDPAADKHKEREN